MIMSKLDELRKLLTLNAAMKTSDIEAHFAQKQNYYSIVLQLNMRIPAIFSRRLSSISTINITKTLSLIRVLQKHCAGMSTILAE